MIAAFAGRRETGKSKAAGVLALHFRVVSFADALRRAVERAAGLRTVRTIQFAATAGGLDWDFVRTDPAAILAKPTAPEVRCVRQGVGQAVVSKAPFTGLMHLPEGSARGRM